MNAQNEKLQSIEKLTKNSLTTIQKNTWGEDAILTTVPVAGGYNGMFLTAHSLINVCRAAIEAKEGVEQDVSLLDISNTLELATEFIPLEGAEYLDKMRAEFDNKPKKP